MSRLQFAGMQALQHVIPISALSLIGCGPVIAATVRDEEGIALIVQILWRIALATSMGIIAGLAYGFICGWATYKSRNA